MTCDGAPASAASPSNGWRVGPSAGRPQHMHDAADHPAVVDPRHAARLRRKVRLETSELFIRQPEATDPIGVLHEDASESRFAQIAKPLMGPDPSTNLSFYSPSD